MSTSDALPITGFMVFYPDVDGAVQTKSFDDRESADKFHKQYVPGHALIVPVTSAIVSTPEPEAPKDIRTKSEMARDAAINVIKTQGVNNFDARRVLLGLATIMRDDTIDIEETYNLMDTIFETLREMGF